MRILYLSLSYIPSRRASSVQVMKMCAALAAEGHEVVLVAKEGPAREAARAADDFAFYGVEPRFRLEKLARPARRGGAAVYAAGMAQRVVAHRRWVDLVYCRDPVGGVIASWMRLPFVYEAHGLPTNRLLRAMWRQMVGSRRFVAMVAISEALRRDIRAERLLPGRDCIVAHDAADPPVHEPAISRRPNGDRPHVGYVGNLYAGRGIEILVELARRMPEVAFDVVGGSDRDIERWRAVAPENVAFHGFHPPSRLGEFYRRFDVLLMPYNREGVLTANGQSDTSRWASPMKMFEYMASGVPTVSSDLPVLQEVLRHGENALIARCDDVDDWAAQVRALLADPDLRLRLARTAQEDLVRHHTWQARARHVMDLLPDLRAAHGSLSPEARLD